MAMFTVRVELHGAQSGEYEVLNQTMRSAGFKTVTTNELGTYALPTGQYDFEGEIGGDEVMSKAHEGAQFYRRGFSVIVTEAASLAWFGLKEL